ncbi:hypothetical protein [Leptospira interrogans]|nr:hypothetical protein [Leptospira interrogans]
MNNHSYVISEKDLTDELIAKEVLKWEFNPEVGWCTSVNRIER